MANPLRIDRAAVAALCRKYGVKRLAVFGSATTTAFDPERSDVDFFLEFLACDADSLQRYFGLEEELEALLGRPVDLVPAKALENPYFAAEARRTVTELYAA